MEDNLSTRSRRITKPIDRFGYTIEDLHPRSTNFVKPKKRRRQQKKPDGQKATEGEVPEKKQMSSTRGGAEHGRKKKTGYVYIDVNTNANDTLLNMEVAETQINNECERFGNLHSGSAPMLQDMTFDIKHQYFTRSVARKLKNSTLMCEAPCGDNVKQVTKATPNDTAKRGHGQVSEVKRKRALRRKPKGVVAKTTEVVSQRPKARPWKHPLSEEVVPAIAHKTQFWVLEEDTQHWHEKVSKFLNGSDPPPNDSSDWKDPKSDSVEESKLDAKSELSLDDESQFGEMEQAPSPWRVIDTSSNSTDSESTAEFDIAALTGPNVQVGINVDVKMK